MKLTIRLKLMPTQQQTDVLINTIETFNQACNHVSQIAHAEKTFNLVHLHKKSYYAIRERFNLSSQMAIRVIGRIIETYKRDKTKHHRFRPHAAMVLDSRLLTYKAGDRLSISTLAGRMMMPFVFGQHAVQYLSMIKGEADLLYRDGKFFLLQTVEVADKLVNTSDDFLGLDMGIVNLVSDSDGQHHAGKAVNQVRYRAHRLRSRLQQKGTRSARRLLKHRRRKESRFARDVNHVISKQLVEKAQDTGRDIALEDLTGIRTRITARKPQRHRLHSWSFHQLRSFIEYKAQLAGVLVVLVDPHNTSRTCPSCGYIDKKNRPSQSHFSCVRCGTVGHADLIAAENIRRAAINRPYVDGTIGSVSSYKPSSLLRGS